MSTLKDLLQKADSCKEKIASALPSKNDYESAGQGPAWDFMLELARQQDMNITEDTVKTLHRLLYRKGEAAEASLYRTIQVTVPETGDVPPAPEEVPRLMSHLADQIHFSRSTLHPVELAAMAHKRLLDIYPFIDGNEKTALLLMNLILVHTGYGAVTITPDRQKDYISALTASRQLNDMEPFSILIARCVISARQNG